MVETDQEEVGSSQQGGHNKVETAATAGGKAEQDQAATGIHEEGNESTDHSPTGSCEEVGAHFMDEDMWVCQFDAVSTQGNHHRVGVRELRVWDTSELECLVAIDQQVFGVGAWTLKCFKRYVKRFRGGGYAAVINGVVVGFVLQIETRKYRTIAELANVAVLGEFRQMGIASALLRTTLDDLTAKGYDLAKLHVASQNYAAQNLYMKHGFTQTDYKEGYYSDEEDSDAVVMCRDLRVTDEETCCSL